MTNSSPPTWRHGDRVKLATQVGITRQHLCHILKGRMRASTPELAESLMLAAHDMGYQTSIMDWMFPGRSDNKLFG